MDTNILQSFGIMLLAVCILAMVLFILKKISKRQNDKNFGFDLNVISKISLQPKNHLFVVKAANKILVLGVSDNNISILTELEPNFDEELQNKSPEALKDTVLSKISSSNNKKNISQVGNNKMQELDLSFMKFIKSSLNLK